MIKITMNGGRTTVESDTLDDGDIVHNLILNNHDVLGAMRVCGVDVLEARDYCDLRPAFDKVYKERTGKTQGYFNPFW